MQRKPVLRLVALLALAGLAACESPTASSTLQGAAPRLVLSPAPVSVTNSNGTPLVSWTPQSGATSYTVRLITYTTLNGQYQRRSFRTLTSTTGSSYLDTDNTYTGTYVCSNSLEFPNGDVYGYWYEYEVVTVYPTGTASSRVYAPITYDNC